MRQHYSVTNTQKSNALDPDFSSEAIEQQTEAFLKAKGKIQHIPVGVTKDNPQLTMRQLNEMTGRRRFDIHLPGSNRES